MIRIPNVFVSSKCLKLSAEPLSNLQNVRWIRKPRWLGTAKSKIFRVSPRPVIPEDEANELKRLENHYRTSTNSLVKYLEGEYQRATQQTVDPQLLQQAFEKDYERCSKINDEWNAKVKITREARFQGELNELIRRAEEKVEKRKKDLQEQLGRAEEEVKRVKEIAETFITRENIDQAIEKALSNEVDYNFAVDLNGNKINGRETTPEDTQALAQKVELKQ